MGSFSYTCSVSNLPIVAGTPVRFFALMQRPYDTPACYIDAFWVPLSLPLQGVYNDYGSIEDITSPKEIRDLFFQALREYAVERGIGSNSVHDVAVHKDMNEDEWLEALWEGRVLVRDPAALRFGELDVFLKPGPEPLGFPTLKSVEDAISKEGHKVTRRGYSEGYYVEELRLGYVRVRTDQEFGKEVELLSRLKLENFATVIMMSPERPNGADLLVVPKPGQERGFGIAPIGQSSLVDPQTFQVAQAMIREDVWQYLHATSSQIKLEGDIQALKSIRDFPPEVPVESLSAEQFELYRKAQAFLSNCKLQLRLILRGVPEAMFVSSVAEITDDYIQTITEYIKVCRALGAHRCPWTSGCSVGDQFGDFPTHQKFHEAMAKISALKAQEAESD